MIYVYEDIIINTENIKKIVKSNKHITDDMCLYGIDFDNERIYYRTEKVRNGEFKKIIIMMKLYNKV